MKTKIGLWIVSIAALAGCAGAGEYAPLEDSPAGERDRVETPSVPALPEPPELTEEAALEEYVRYAAANHPKVKSAWHRWRGNEERIVQARGLADPELEYSYSTPDNHPRHKYGVSQKIPWYGKRDLRSEVERSTARAQALRFEAVWFEVREEVRRAYAEYAFLARGTAITQDHEKLLAELEEGARGLYETGGTSQQSVLQFEVERERVRDELRTLRDRLRPASARLNAALGRKPGEPLPAPRRISPEAAALPEKLESLLLEHSPELREISEREGGDRAAMDLARRNYYPDLTVGAAYMDNIGEEDDVELMVGITLPLWWGKYRGAEREVRHRLESTRLEREDRVRRLLAELEEAAFEYRDALRKTDLYRDRLIPKTEQAFDAARQGYAAGRASFLEVVEIERELLEFRLALERSLADQVTARGRLERLVGQELQLGRSDGHE